MRVVPLLIILVVCGLSASVAPDPSTATGFSPAVIASADTDDAEYQALQQQADMALDALKQSRERRLANARLAAN